MAPAFDSKMKKLTAIMIGLTGGVVLATAWIMVAWPCLRYFAPPKVTVINATGHTTLDVNVTLGKASAVIGELKDGQQATASVPGTVGACSTGVQWQDLAGINNARAEDYMEGCGFYHSTVIVTPDNKAKAIYQRIEPDGPAHGSQPIRSETNRSLSAAGSRR